MKPCACGRYDAGQEIQRQCPRRGNAIFEDHSDECCLRMTFDMESCSVIGQRTLDMRWTPPRPPHPWIGTSDWGDA